MSRRHIVALCCMAVVSAACQRSTVIAEDRGYPQVSVAVYNIESEPAPSGVVPPVPLIKTEPYIHKVTRHPPRAPPTHCQFHLPPAKPLPRPPEDVDDLKPEVFDSVLGNYVAAIIDHDREYKAAVATEYRLFQKRCR